MDASVAFSIGTTGTQGTLSATASLTGGFQLHTNVTNTVALWQFQGDLVDATGNSNDLSMFAGTAGYSTQRGTQGFNFNGTRTLAKTASDLQIGTEMTFQFIIKLAASGVATWAMCYPGTSNTLQDYHWFTSGGSNNLAYADKNNATTTNGPLGPPYASVPALVGATHHVTFRRKFVSGTTYEVRAFVDGVAVGIPFNVTAITPAGTEKLYVGGYHGAPELNGTVTSLRLLSEGRSDANILADYQATIGTQTITFGTSSAVLAANIAGTSTVTFGSTATLVASSNGASTMLFSTNPAPLTGSGAALATSTIIFGSSAAISSTSFATAAITFGVLNPSLTSAGAIAASASITFGTFADPFIAIQNTPTWSMNLLDIVPAHTVALYQFQNNKDDSSGNVLNLSVDTGTEQYTDLWPGSGLRAFDFNGSTALIAPNDSSFRFTGDFTVQFIGVRRDNTDETFWALQTGGGPFGYLATLGFTTGIPAIVFGDHQTPIHSLGYRRDSSNEIHLFTLTRKNNIVRFFVDNNEINSISEEVIIFTPDGFERFRVGGDITGGRSRTKMASLRILDIARTDNQILSDYTSTIANTSDVLFTSYGTPRGDGVLAGSSAMFWDARSLVTVMTTGSASMTFAANAPIQGLIRIFGTSTLTFSETGTLYTPSVTSMTFGASGTMAGRGPLVSQEININIESGTSVLINIQVAAIASIIFDAQLVTNQVNVTPKQPPFVHFRTRATGKITVNNDIIRSRVTFLTNEHRVTLMNTNKLTVSKV